MDLIAPLVLIITVALVPPIFLAAVFQRAYKKWRPKGKSHKPLFYIAGASLWFLGLGSVVAFGGSLLNTFNSSRDSMGNGGPDDRIPEFPWRDRMGNGGPDDRIPEFPWPPPAASSFVTIPLLGPMMNFPEPERDDRDFPLLMDADFTIRIALAEASQHEASYYSVPDGFALVSRLEQIEEDGSPKPISDRWEVNAGSFSRFSLRDYLRSLFLAPPGYYRLVVFVVSPLPFSQSPQSVSRDVAESWLQFGSNVLPLELALRPFTEQFICTALIYEFEKFDTQDEPVLKRPGRLSAMTHIDKSGIGRSLQ